MEILDKFAACKDVLFEPALIGKHALSVQEAITLAISYAGEAETRSILWDSCILTGGMANMPGMRDAVERRVSALLVASETSNEYQPKECQWKGLPDHFIDYQGRPGDVNFVGASVISKVGLVGWLCGCMHACMRGRSVPRPGLMPDPHPLPPSCRSCSRAPRT